MKKLSSLLILLAFSLCLCFSASADPIEYYSGTWFLTSIEAGGTAFDPSVLGVEMSMTPIGERTGAIITKSKNVFLIMIITFIQSKVEKKWVHY